MTNGTAAFPRQGALQLKTVNVATPQMGERKSG